MERKARVRREPPPRPHLPPRAPFVDAAHYAAMLATLDGADRLREAMRHPIGSHERYFYASHAMTSLRCASSYLAASAIGRSPLHASRPEYGREIMEHRIACMVRQLSGLLPPPSHPWFRFVEYPCQHTVSFNLELLP